MPKLVSARRKIRPVVRKPETFAELIDRLGNIPPERVRLQPPPGTATEQDVVAALESPRKRLWELVDGVLVEKPMGLKESLLAAAIIGQMEPFADENDLGVVTGADGALRLMPGLVRIPDIAFFSWDKLPNRELPDEPVPDLVPDLAIEIVSKGNTVREMERKLREYFQVGVLVVWLIYPKTRTAEVYTAPAKFRRIGKDEALDGGRLLPGFRLPLKHLFARLRRKKK